MTSTVLNVLINCEESGVIREAFSALGHNSWSCDLEPSRIPGNHLQCDALESLGFLKWDLMIAHPPCTYLANSGSLRLYKGGKKINGKDESRWEKMRAAAVFFRSLLEADIPHICIENPIMFGYGIEIIGRNFDQLIQPHWFGHPESKATCLWKKDLPDLIPTNKLRKPSSGHWENQTPSGQNKIGPGPNRQRDRSATYPGIGQAMAEQWSRYILEKRAGVDKTERQLSFI